MDRQPVASSSLVSVGYDKDSSVLEVEFATDKRSGSNARRGPKNRSLDSVDAAFDIALDLVFPDS
jgi:hypothetical protein